MFHAKLTGAVYASALFALTAAAADTATTKKTVTFTKDVAPIFQNKCEECHRPGTGAPMSLVSYEEVRPWAKSIKQRVATRNMPPWHIDKTSGIQHFANDRSLSDDQIATIVSWVDAGAPKGDPKDMPAAKSWPDGQGWVLAKQFGEPGIVLKSEDYTMPAHGQDVWFKPLTAVDITEPRWVRAVEIRPSTAKGRKIMHHVLARLQQDEKGVEAGASDDASGGGANGGPGLLMEWAIGKNYDIYRENTGKLLLPGSHIWWELHLHAVGEEIRDHAELAVYFYPKGQEPKYRTRLNLFTGMSGQRGLDIAPNSISETVGYTLLRSPARLENYQPHMHLRGKAMSMEQLQLQLDEQLHLRRRRGSGVAERHHHQDHRVVRQHDGESAQPGSEPVGWFWRSHGRRNVARVGQRDQHLAGGLRRVGGEAQAGSPGLRSDCSAAVRWI
jgi:mono/diheme cytochrome c family protein